MLSFTTLAVLAIAAQSLFAGVDAAVLPKRRPDPPSCDIGKPFDRTVEPIATDLSVPIVSGESSTFPGSNCTTPPVTGPSEPTSTIPDSGTFTILPYPPFTPTASPSPPPTSTSSSTEEAPPTNVPAESLPVEPTNAPAKR